MARTNRHHNIPGSRGGSGEKCNISTVEIKRHDQFHAWAWNRTPCTLLRLMALHGIGKDGKTIDPSALEDFFSILTPENWLDIYKEETTMYSGRNADRDRHEKAEHYQRCHFLEELYDMERFRGALTLDRQLPSERQDDFLKDILQFFEVENAKEAILRFLQESRVNELSWAKSISDDVRLEIRDLLFSARMVSCTKKKRTRVLNIVKVQHRQLTDIFSQIGEVTSGE